MGKGHGVSGHTYTQAQLDHYANHTTPITMLIGRTKTTMQTNAIRTTMSIGISGNKIMTK